MTASEGEPVARSVETARRFPQSRGPKTVVEGHTIVFFGLLHQA